MDTTPDMIAVGIKCPACDRPAKVSPVFIYDFYICRAILCDHGKGYLHQRKLAEVRGYPHADAEMIQRAINDEYERGGGNTFVRCYWPEPEEQQG